MKWLFNLYHNWGRSDQYAVFHNFLKEEVLETLCKKIPFAMFVNVVIAGVIVYFFYSLADRSMLLLWYGAVILLSLYRALFARKKCREADGTLEMRYRQFRSEALAMAFLWALLPMLFYPSHDFSAQLVMMAILLGIAAGGALNLIIDQRVSDIYILVILGAFLVRFCQLDPTHLSLSFLILLYIITLLYGTRQLHRIVMKGIMQYRKVDELQYRLDQIFEQAPVGMLYFDKNYTVIDINKAMMRIFHLPKSLMQNRNLLSLKDKRAIKDLPKVIEKGLSTHYEGPYITTSTNEEIWISVIFSPLKDMRGKVIGGIAVIQDKSSEHEAWSKAEFLAYHDPLTHLPNRKLLEDRYKLQITQASREGYYSAMLFLDLDRFKHVNDTYGHNIGDLMIKETANRLSNILRRSDTVCRLGGDEFIIFLPMISKDSDKAVRRIWHISTKIHQSLSQPYKLGKHTLYITTSVGAILIHGDREPLDQILRKVDIAMYHAKHQGKGVTSFYEEDMDKRLRRTIELENALRYAIERDELYLEFQPIVRATNGRIAGAESLLRWRMSDGTFVQPSEFIPVAEESTLIHEIGLWVIEQACRSLRDLRHQNLFHSQYISINLSAKQFGNQNLFDEVMQILRECDIDPTGIKFEITESILMEDPHNARDMIKRFNEAGIAFLIDDFGTGYSSLSYLKTFNFDTIKIDRSFIRDILDDPDDVTLVKAILDIARQFDNRVVAEGVESKEQVEILTRLEPDILCQGFFFSKPLCFDDFREWAARHS